MKFFNFSVVCFLLSFSVFAEVPEENISVTKNTNENNFIRKNPSNNKLSIPGHYKLELKNIISSDALNFLQDKISKEFYDKERLVFELEKLKLVNEYKNLKFHFEQFDSMEQRNLDLAILKYKNEKYSYEVDLLKLQVEKQLEDFKLANLNRMKKIEEYKHASEEIVTKQRMLSLQKEFDQRVVVQDSDKYLLNPILKNGNIRISDRKVYLNGEINLCKARYVVDMINYYNNKNCSLPIFIVINFSPGGGANAGNQILNAISFSRAPVYVVVTGYAASMAALIVTISDRSFVLKEAIILHHLGSMIHTGKINLREAKDNVSSLGELTKRFTGLVASKMGISLEELIKRMYEKNTQGCWKEFGDNAVKLKWATGLINGIEDVSIDEKPIFDNYIKGKNSI